MKNVNKIVAIVILLVVVLLVMLLSSVVRSKGEVDNELMEVMNNDVAEILAEEKNNLDKASDLLNLFIDEKNKGNLNSHELNLIINNYEANIIEDMLDTDYEHLNEYNDSLKFIYALRMISGYQLKPWESIEKTNINGQNIEVITNAKDYEIKGDAFYFSQDAVGEIPKYFDFDAWLSLLDDVLSKEYPEKYPSNGNISSGFKIIEKWTSQKFVVQLLNNYFLASTYSELSHYNITVDEFKTVDGLTIFIMLVNEENNVIDLEELYKFGEKYSLNEGVEYLNETYGNARGNDFDMLDEWLEEEITDPLDGTSTTRDNVLWLIEINVKDALL